MCSFSKPKVETPAVAAAPVSENDKAAETGEETAGQTKKRKAQGKKALKIDSSSGASGTGLNI